MLSLEDYMDDLGNLPQEISNGLEAIKELDGIVKNSMDHTKQSIDILFSNAATINDYEFHQRFKKIMKNSEISIKKSEKKIILANNMQGFLTKYMKQLDTEMEKRKIDFKDDNITGPIKKKVLSLKQGSITNQKRNKYEANKRNFINTKREYNSNIKIKQTPTSTLTSSSNDTALSSKRDFNSKSKIKQTPTPTLTSSSNDTALASKRGTSLRSSMMNHSLLNTSEYLGPSNIDIVTTESQDIIATQQSFQKRIPNNLEESLEGIIKCTLNNKTYISSDKLPKKCLTINKLKEMDNSNPQMDKTKIYKRQQGSKYLQKFSDEGVDVMHVDEPNNLKKRRYCFCHDIAYGFMIVCDSKMCPHGWYHYECVGITETPKGKWFCQLCLNRMKNRRLHR